MRHLRNVVPQPKDLCQGGRLKGISSEGWIAISVTAGFVVGMLVGFCCSWMLYRRRLLKQALESVPGASAAPVCAPQYDAAQPKYFAPLSTSAVGEPHYSGNWSATNSKHNSLASRATESLAMSRTPAVLDMPPLRHCDSPDRGHPATQHVGSAGAPLADEGRPDIRLLQDSNVNGSLKRPAGLIPPAAHVQAADAAHRASMSTSAAALPDPPLKAALDPNSDYNPFYDPKLTHVNMGPHRVRPQARLAAPSTGPSPAHKPGQPAVPLQVRHDSIPTLTQDLRSQGTRPPALSVALSAAPSPSLAAARAEPIPLMTPQPLSPDPESPSSTPSTKGFAFPVLNEARQSKEQESFGEVLLLEMDARLQAMGQPPLVPNERSMALRLLLQQRSATADVAAAMNNTVDYVRKTRVQNT